MTIAIITALSLVIVTGISIGLPYFNNSALRFQVYAQSGTSNTSSLSTEESNTTTISEENSTEYLQYEDSDVGFKIDYPSDWEPSDKLGNNAIAAFSPPPSYDVEVDVKVYPRPNSMSLKTFGDTSIKNSDSYKVSAYYRNGTTLLGGQPAIRAVGTLILTPNYAESLQGETSTTQKVLTMTTLLKERKSFLELIFYADKSNFNDYLPQVEHMIKSFQFQNTKPTIQEED